MARGKVPKEKAPWERLENETPHQHRMFQSYLEQNSFETGVTPRSIKLFCIENGYQQSYIYGVSMDNRWRERAAAYDDYISEKIRTAQEKAAIKMAQEHAKIGETMRQRGIKRITEIKEKDLNATDALALVREGIKIERQARGEPGEVTGHRHEGQVKVETVADIDLSKLSEGELSDLEQILNRINSGKDQSEDT